MSATNIFERDMINAREGVVFFWSRIDPVAKPSLLLPLTFDGIKMARSSAKDIAEGVENIGQTIAEAGAKTASQLKSWAIGLIEKLSGAIGQVLDVSWINWIADNLVGRIAPFLGDIIGGIKGLVKFGKSLVQKVRLWWQGRHVELVPGHPQTMAAGINKLVTNAMLEGAYGIAKAAVSAGLKFVSMGVSTIVNAVASIVEFIVRLVNTVIEAVNIDWWIDYCKNLWGGKSQQARSERQAALSGDAKDFNQNFVKYTNRAPIIAAITSNTNLAGNKMLLMKMFSDDGSVIDQSQFDAGCVYLESLKSTGRDYCKNWGKRLQTSDSLAQLSLNLVRYGNAFPPRPLYKRLLRIR